MVHFKDVEQSRLRQQLNGEFILDPLELSDPVTALSLFWLVRKQSFLCCKLPDGSWLSSLRQICIITRFDVQQVASNFTKYFL